MENLRKLRKEKGYTCESLGKLINVQKSAVAKYERGEIRPSKDILLKISKVLNCTTDYLYGITNDPMPVNIKNTDNMMTAKEKAIIDAYNSKPELQGVINKLLEIDADEYSSVFAAATGTNEEPRMVKISKKTLKKLKNAPETEEI